MSYPKVALSTLLLSMFFINSGNAGEGGFVTIIGPDGHPMVVPHPEPKKLKNTQSAAELKSEKILQQSTAPQVVAVPTATQAQVDASQSGTKQVKVEPKTTVSVQDVKKAASVEKNAAVEQSIVQQQTIPAEQAASEHSYQMIDGEKYYEAEYLESKEFNLEQKKRFYQIPNTVGGGANWDVVEREKGVDMSWFRSSQQHKPKQESVALGKDYKILSKELLLEALPIQCIDDKAKRKAKEFGIEKPLSLWSRTPMDDRFDYQLVKLDQTIENFRLTSYANSVNAPTYYWPMIIFLDEQGCVLEGVSAFYSQSYPMTMLQNESIEGIVHIPQYSKFMMLAALEQAVDLPTLKLSHQGQIKLTVLR
ncbi:MAG: putative pilus assembly protein FilE [Acinetobacter sp.]|jgi:hypothetical protein|nr:MAG: putative pilus assembly protein FilE [Acinetobacter sp.]